MPAQRSPVIAVVGSTNVDLVAYVTRVPEPGETVIGQRFAVSFGGKGANQAVMARRQGAEVSLIARVGDDAYGEMTLEDLTREGVDTSHVRVVPAPTGVAPIWVEPDGTNRIVVIPGANHVWVPGEAAAAVEAIATLDVVIGQLEIPQAVTAAAFDAAKRRRAMTILNPAPAAPLLPELLAVTDWLVPNEEEFSALATDADLPGATLQERLESFAERSDRRLVVTLGANGAVLVNADGSLAHVAAPDVVAVDTTGAGDAFIGALACGLGAGLTELEAVGRAVVVASDSVTRAGARAAVARRGRG